MSNPTVFTVDIIRKFADVDLYNTLGMNRESFTPELVKKKFRKLALKYHPDKNPNDPEANQKFIMLEIAYKILYNKESRELYDIIYSEANLDDETYSDLKAVDRTKVSIPLSMDGKTFEKEIRRKNLEMDPDFYNNRKFTDEEIATKIREEQSNSNVLSDELTQKFKTDMELLNSINDEKMKADKFNEMFETSKQKAKHVTHVTQVVAFNGNSSVTNTNRATMSQYNTMFSDVDMFDESFDTFNNELDEEEELSFDEYEKQYNRGFDELYDVSKTSTLKNGRADYRFDEE